MEIQYRFALDEHGQPVDVMALQRTAVGPNEVFKCVACGGHLIPKLGEIKTKHFAHKNLTLNCARETYLHQLSKKTFHSEYVKCLEKREPFYLIRSEPLTCDHFETRFGYTCARTETKHYDLTRYFDKISVEQHHNGFVADVLLQSSKTGEVLFIEFAVTHKCDEEKLKGGFRIIEYFVEDETHLESIKAHRFAAGGKHVSLHNFRAQTGKRSVCSGKCTETLNVFVIYGSKKSILLQLAPHEDMRSQLKGDVRHFEVLGKAGGDRNQYISLYRQKVRESYFKNIPIRNCFVCRYHGGDGVENAVFCKVHKRSVGSNQAVECSKYRPLQSLTECLELDKKNEEFVRRTLIRKMVRTMLPGL